MAVFLVVSLVIVWINTADEHVLSKFSFTGINCMISEREDDLEEIFEECKKLTPNLNNVGHRWEKDVRNLS